MLQLPSEGHMASNALSLKRPRNAGMATVQDTNLQAQQDSMILSVIEQMSEQMINHVNNWEKANKEQNNESITDELERYKERAKTFNRRLNIDCFVVPMFSPGDDPIACLNKAMAFLTVVTTLRGDKGKIIMVLLIRAMPLVQGEILQVDKQELLNATTAKVKDKWLDVLLTVMNSTSWNNDSVNMEMQKCDLYEKCLNRDAELSKSKQAYNDLLKNYSQLEKHCISLEVSMQLKQEVFQNDKSCVNHNAIEIQEYFENNDLKAQLQDKDTTICKLKDTIISLSKNTKEENVSHDKCELEPINEELENSMAKLLSENEHLCNEINHVKQVFKDQFDSIKQTRFHHKEHNDSLINKFNLKSMEIEDLKAQNQDKVCMITSLKNNLRKSKGKEIVENVVHLPSATTISPGMFKLDLEPLPPRLLQNRKSHIDYLRNTKKQANILREIVEQAKAKHPFDGDLDLA
ncbi:hypothetical protein Tco_1049615, partial [Tanacetum coccineum]